MKAWKVENPWQSGSAVVFAETRGKAHYLVLTIDGFEDAEWNDVRVTRFQEMDKMWRDGKREMDWDDPKDRIALVKCGWHCDPDWVEVCHCEACCANDFCDYYRDVFCEGEKK